MAAASPTSPARGFQGKYLAMVERSCKSPQVIAADITCEERNCPAASNEESSRYKTIVLAREKRTINEVRRRCGRTYLLTSRSPKGTNRKATRKSVRKKEIFSQ